MNFSVSALRVLGVLLILANLTSQPTIAELRDAPPTISIETSNGITLRYDVGLNIWNGAVYDRTPTDAFFFMRQSGESIPFVSLADTIRITFDGNIPDSWTLHDHIDGTIRGDQILEISFVENTAAFTLEAFPEALTRALSEKYALPPNYRTFLLVCAWGEDVCEYAFGFATNQ
jgi:hypothetical protein